MKGRWQLIIGILAGIGLGYSMGYLRVPYVEADQTFWIGFVCSLFICTLLFSDTGKVRSSPRKEKIFWSALAILIFSGSLTFLLIERAQRIEKSLLLDRTRILAKEQALSHAEQEVEKARLLLPLVEQMLHGTGDSIQFSESQIDHLVRISDSFSPYPYVTNDTVSTNLYSPQRAQLLTILLSVPFTNRCFTDIKNKVSFAHADFTGAEFSKVDLCGIDLRSAHFQQATLIGVNLTDADLRSCDFKGANLNAADLEKVDSRRADFSWANLEKATLIGGNFDSATGENTILIKADLSGARLQYAFFDNAIFHSATLRDTDCEATWLRNADFTQANLHGSNFNRSRVQGVRFSETNLDTVSVTSESWILHLDKWKVLGKEEVEQQFSIIPDRQRRYTNSKFLLVRRSATD